MNYLKRKTDDYLINWKKNPNRSPLIIKGARQVGKTETVRKFARENYASVIEINFFTYPEYKNITEEGFDPVNIIRLISRINPTAHFIPGETLIFFDEIQEYPNIATSLKFFKEDGRYDVICSGSLLGIQYKHIDSISVGSKTDYTMRSLDFEEFLYANGYGSETVISMLEHMINGNAFSQVEHKRFSSLFLDYCILGGMPAVVSNYIDNRTFEDSLTIQRQLLIDYESDIRKYAESLDQTKILNVFRSIPAQLAKENKKFQYSQIAKGARSKEYLGCVDWLEDAGIINCCPCMNFPELPIKGNLDISKFKVYMADTGLLIASLDDESQFDLRANKNLGTYKGALYENFAAEALTKQGYVLCYYKRENSTLEEDFFIRSANELIPVEVKANTNQAKSMSQLIKSEHYPDIRHGIKFNAGNVGFSNPVYTFPYYCIFLLKGFMSEQSIFE